jgi:hypothetical protein
VGQREGLSEVIDGNAWAMRDRGERSRRACTSWQFALEPFGNGVVDQEASGSEDVCTAIRHGKKYD